MRSERAIQENLLFLRGEESESGSLGASNRSPLFCVPGAGDSVLGWMELIAHLTQVGKVFGLESRGLDGALPPHSSVRAAAAAGACSIREVYRDRPIHLAGHSFGGWVAFEIAQERLRAGEAVASLILVDGNAPDEDLLPLQEYTHVEVILEWLKLVALLRTFAVEIARADLEPYSEERQRQLLHEALVSAGSLSRRSTPEDLRGRLDTFAAALRASYRPDCVYSQPVTLVLVDDPALDPLENAEHKREIERRWRRWAPRLDCVAACGNHMTVLREPHASALARIFDATQAQAASV